MKKFNVNSKKSNLITYMPRKLFRHSELVVSFLQKLLPQTWSIKSIQNMPEKKVFEILSKSKIFLSYFLANSSAFSNRIQISWQ